MAATLLPSATAEDVFYRLSVEQYDSMIEAGTIGEDDHVELLDGILYSKMTQFAPHTTVLVKLNEWLVLRTAHLGFSTRPQVPIRLAGKSRPEPDIAVVRGGADDFPEQPTGDQVSLAVEIADKASDRLLRIKTKLYAQGGVKELWIIDVQERRVELHREPGDDGYRVVTILAETEPFSPLFLPEHSLRGADVLPRVSNGGTRSV